jgi:hypothetical protein
VTTATIEVKIWEALRAHLEAMAGLPFVAWPSESFDPPQTGGLPDQYLIVTDFRNDPNRLFHGSDDPTELRGIFDVAVMTPIRFKHAVGLQMAGLVAAHFAQDDAISFDGTIVRVTRKPSASGAPARDGDCWRLPVSIFWRAFA